MGACRNSGSYQDHKTTLSLSPKYQHHEGHKALMSRSTLDGLRKMEENPYRDPYDNLSNHIRTSIRAIQGQSPISSKEQVAKERRSLTWAETPWAHGLHVYLETRMWLLLGFDVFRSEITLTYEKVDGSSTLSAKQGNKKRAMA